MEIEVFGERHAQAKGFTAGTHRARSPAETYAAYAPWLPRFGITRIANVTGLDALDVPVDVAVRPASRSLAAAQGKGADPAAVHGLCEVIERDALALWELGGAADAEARQLDLTTVRSPACVDVLRRLAAADVRCAAWERTSDVGVPTYAAEIYEPADRPGWSRTGIFAGDGTHLCAEIALGRALFEAVQSRLTFVSGSRDDLYAPRYSADPTAAAARIRSHERPAPRRRFAEHGPGASPTLEEDLQRLLAALRASGVDEVAVVDLRRSEFAIPAVKVIAPGLEGKLASLNYQPVDPARVARRGGSEVRS